MTDRLAMKARKEQYRNTAKHVFATERYLVVLPDKVGKDGPIPALPQAILSLKKATRVAKAAKAAIVPQVLINGTWVNKP